MRVHGQLVDPSGYVDTDSEYKTEACSACGNKVQAHYYENKQLENCRSLHCECGHVECNDQFCLECY